MARIAAEVGSTANKYEILAKLATGGMADIFLARGESGAGVERYCVLKRILRDRAGDAQLVQMFLDEARLAAQLQHPNIAAVYLATWIVTRARPRGRDRAAALLHAGRAASRLGRARVRGGRAVSVTSFIESRNGHSLTSIAHGLNRDAIPPPRVGSKHKCFGWGSSTIRAILYNERYIGVWRFKEKQWVKIPGTNRRQPRARNATEVIVRQRPELRIIDQKLWDAVQARLAMLKKKYASGRCAALR